LNSLKRDLQNNLGHYHSICQQQRGKGHEQEALSAERDLEAARDRPRPGNKPENPIPAQATATKYEQSKRANKPEKSKPTNATPAQREPDKPEHTRNSTQKDAPLPKDSVARDSSGTPYSQEGREQASHRRKEYRLKQRNVQRWLADQGKVVSASVNVPPIEPSSAPPTPCPATAPFVRAERSKSDQKPSGPSSVTDVTSVDSEQAPASSELRALHLSHVDLHQGFWEIVEDEDRRCAMCEMFGTLLQCPACEIQACSNCKSALGAPGGSFGPRAKANWM